MRVFFSIFWCVYGTFCLGQSLQKADSLFKEEAYKEAITFYQKLLNNTKILTDSTSAKIYHQLGLCQYFLFQDQAAIHSWIKALEIRRQILPKNHTDLLKNYRNLGNAYVNINQLDMAKEHFGFTILPPFCGFFKLL